MTVQYGLLVDYDYCSGCHSCEVACRKEHDYGTGQFGIKMLEMGPWEKMEKGQWEHNYYPVLTSYCDLCADRVAAGGEPSCQLHCLASAIQYGTLEELATEMATRDRATTLLIP